MLEQELSPYILLTPGPLSTSPSVRAAMRYDSCTWDMDYKSIVTEIRNKLLHYAECNPDEYTTVLMQGSGTFGVESVLGSSIHKKTHQLLILVNGVYGKRMVQMAKILELPYLVYEVNEDQSFTEENLRAFFQENKNLTHLAMVHCETTTGILNDLCMPAKIAKEFDAYFIVDAMSSFAGIELDITQLDIDFLISSANKCIQGVPGFSFVICKTTALRELCENNAKSLSLNLYDQWQEMEKHAGKWRYTSPTHTVLAFKQALLELDHEGGISARAKRYQENQRVLVEGMQELGFAAYIPTHLQSSIITTFLEPEYIPQTKKKFVFTDFYQYLKKNGFVIYPGKITNRNSFRIGTIGHLFPDDVKRFLHFVKSYIN